ncbi:hypothetical protein [Curtobacterium sp. MCBD17_013]|uniref:hypothetical protein n=1 Tax=Curtobacterium sp. MCBD17_013 TaxID=2175668 RepID=UPI0011B827C3|nr:hypothetical protein [Curtobacterium sp. MCBD17_013]
MKLGNSELDALRRSPREWRRRGLTPPSELAAMIEARLREDSSTTVSPQAADAIEDRSEYVPPFGDMGPKYADFFR